VEASAPRRARKGLWLAMAGGAAIVLATVVALFAFGGREEAPRVSVPVAPTPSPEQHNRITAATALAEARARFAEGDLPSALHSAARAELADPQSLEVKLLREAIEGRSREMAADAERNLQVADGLLAGRDAVARKSWDEAAAAARGVLALDPAQDDARLLLAEAQKEQKRERDRAEAARAAAAAAPAPAPEPEVVATAPAVPAPAPARDAPLQIDFASDQSEGVLTIYAGERQIVRESFKFVKKTGFLRSQKISGRIDAQRRVPVGPLILRVYVARAGQATKAVVVDGTIEAGKSYRLAIQVDESGRATAELR
jgi:hypothetical protein